MQAPPDPTAAAERIQQNLKGRPESAMRDSPVVISVNPNRTYRDTGENGQYRLMQPASMENRRIYPPSRVIVSNPFIIETSRELPDKGAEDVSFFSLCLSV